MTWIAMHTIRRRNWKSWHLQSMTSLSMKVSPYALCGCLGAEVHLTPSGARLIM